MDRSSPREPAPGSRIGNASEDRERAMQTRDETEMVFDRWVQGTLQEQYGNALREPLPEALLRLLDAVNPQPVPRGSSR